MSDTTPNSLEPVKKVNVARMSKWPMYAVALAGLLLDAAQGVDIGGGRRGLKKALGDPVKAGAVAGQTQAGQAAQEAIAAGSGGAWKIIGQGA